MTEEKTSPAEISLRSVILPDDESFLMRVYFSTRQDAAAAWAVLGEEKARHLLEMQYKAQKMQYAQDFPDAVYSIILYNKAPAGRLITSESERKLCGVDMALLPEFRNLGIGTFVLNDLIKKASGSGRIFTLQVLKTNRAVSLYKRMGCEIVADTGSHFLMER